MRLRLASLIGLGFISVVASACAMHAAPATIITICGRSMSLPQAMPPANSGAVVLMATPCLDVPGGSPVIPEAYTGYIQLQSSRPENGVWIPYDDKAKQTMEADFRRLWDTGRLGNVVMGFTDYVFPNGVIGKFVTYNIDEGTANPK